MIALREAAGEILVQIGRERKDFVVLDGDLAGGTGMHHFRKAFPERFIQCGIAEQNMVGVAAGLATTGVIPIATSFAVFLSMRALEQARTAAAYSGLPVKLVAAHPGLDVGPDGPSAQAIEDLAIFRAIPGFTVFSPADRHELEWVLRTMLELEGPCYVRTGRSEVPDVHGKRDAWFVGEPLRLRRGTDLTVFATGIMVHRALAAAEILSGAGIEATVVSVPTLKPLDGRAIARLVAETGVAVTAEDHNIIGGLGGAVAEALCEHGPAPLERVGVADDFACSGEPDALATAYHIDVDGVVAGCRRALARVGKLQKDGVRAERG